MASRPFFLVSPLPTKPSSPAGAYRAPRAKGRRGGVLLSLLTEQRSHALARRLAWPRPRFSAGIALISLGSGLALARAAADGCLGGGVAGDRLEYYELFVELLEMIRNY